MKKFLSCLIFLIAIAIPESFAQETTSTPTTEMPLARLHMTGSKNRPRTAIPLWIDCYYDCGIMYFETQEVNCNATVIITNINSGYSCTFCLPDNYTPILISLESGSYSILYVTSESEYEGILTLF